MFRKDLQDRLEKIFGIEKTTFLSPSDKFEQDTLFIDILETRPRMSSAKGGRETAMVTGMLTVYSQDNKLPFGFFAKAIERAEKETVRPFFFFDVDADVPNSPARQVNIHERRTSFTFLYDSQYDPSRGQMTSLVFGE